MIHLNLIPTGQKMALLRERKFLMIHSIIGVLVVLTAVNAMAVTAARYWLIGYFKNLRHDTSLVNIEREQLQEDIAKLNEKIDDVNAVQGNFAKWSEVMEKFVVLFPEGVRLDFMYIDRAGGGFRITGLASTRDDLILAKTRLENAAIISSLDAPLSNFLEKEDVEFRFNGTINMALGRPAPDAEPAADESL